MLVHILLADDESEILDLLRSFFQMAFNTRISTSSNGSSAMILCQQEKFDLIVSDLRMPGMDGADLVLSIRNREGPNQKTPFILLSAFAMDARFKLNSVENVILMDKPPCPEYLTRTASKLMNAPRLVEKIS